MCPERSGAQIIPFAGFSRTRSKNLKIVTKVKALNYIDKIKANG